MQTIGITYNTLKLVADGVVSVYWSALGDAAAGYALYSGAGGIFALSSATDATDIADFEQTLKHAQNEVVSADDAIARVFLASGAPRILPLDSSGLSRVAVMKPNSTEVDIYTHDWTDRTTWYQGSFLVVDEIPTTADFTTYQLANRDVIDTYHGLITQEDFLKDAGGLSYRVSVTVNGAPKTENDPFYLPALHDDYSVNYADGTILFNAPLGPADAVLVTYHAARSSLFTITPAKGTRLDLDSAEAQFSSDVDQTDTVFFQAFGLAEVFAPNLGLPPGTKIPLGNPTTYKTITDFQNAAQKAYPAYPAMGVQGNWRSTPFAIQPFNWPFVGLQQLIAAYGMEIRIWLQHDTPFKGWYATATFYCLSYPSP